LKVSPEARGGRVLVVLLGAAKRHIPASGAHACYGIVMDGTGRLPVDSTWIGGWIPQRFDRHARVAGKTPEFLLLRFYSAKVARSLDMQVNRFDYSQMVPFPQSLVWRFFADAANLPALTPPEAGFEGGEPQGPVFPGQILTHRVRILPGIKLNWVTEILHVDEGRSFTDGQESGPFRLWRHRHELLEAPGGTEVRDTVHWALPLDPFSRVAKPFVRRQVASLFAYRSRVLPEVLAGFAGRDQGGFRG
jgi:ligand-binding SRPBCC domain-containing protein